MWKDRSFARSSGRLCPFQHDIACGKTGRLQGRLAGCAKFTMILQVFFCLNEVSEFCSEFYLAMKRPAARAVHGRVHKCSACHQVDHRIERCPHPAARQILRLRKENRILKRASKRHVLQQEAKTRKGPETTGTYRQKASSAYKGKPAARLPSPAEIRRRKQSVSNFSFPNTEEDAVDWLLGRGWLKSPTVCDKCDCRSFTDLIWNASRRAHWRCKSCSNRFIVFYGSIFHGLRVSALELTQMLRQYVTCDLTKSPSVPDFVQVR